MTSPAFTTSALDLSSIEKDPSSAHRSRAATVRERRANVLALTAHRQCLDTGRSCFVGGYRARCQASREIDLAVAFGTAAEPLDGSAGTFRGGLNVGLVTASTCPSVSVFPVLFGTPQRTRVGGGPAARGATTQATAVAGMAEVL